MTTQVIELPPPDVFGFPAKFKAWYPDQIRAIDFIIANERRFSAVIAPTGSGKSGMMVGAAMLKPGVTRACYLTSTKGLQDQLGQDFSDLGLCDVRGQRNYKCLALAEGGELARFSHRAGSWHGCDEGPCHTGTRCSLALDRKSPGTRPHCLYYRSVHDASRSELVSTNYAFWLAQGAFGEGLGQFDLLILDEGHEAEKELESFLTFSISTTDCDQLHSSFTDTVDVDTWVKWAKAHRGQLQKELDSMMLFPPRDATTARHMRTLKGLLTKLERLSEIKPLDWVAEKGAGEIQFAPMRVSRYAEQCLFRGVEHIIVTSATMTMKTLNLLGVDEQEARIMEVASHFPVARRPVIHVGTMPSVRVDSKMKPDDKLFWRRRIDRLVEMNRDCGYKGVIHTVSYARMKELIADSDHKDIMITHDSHNTMMALRRFKEEPGPLVFVSPSIMTGVDLPYEECRFQIIGKVPMPDTRGSIMKIRTQLDPDYTGYLAMQKLVQAVGRGMRAPDDWCQTMIVDDNFLWFLKKYRKYAPKWFLESIQYYDFYPQPLDL